METAVLEMGLQKLQSQGKIKETVQSVAFLYTEYYNISQDTVLNEKTITFDNPPVWTNNH